MRTLRYDNLHPLGHFPMPTEGTVTDLLFDLPYFIGFGSPFPTREQLNSLLRKGYKDEGMSGGCEWEPFELSADEYAEVARAIEQDRRLAERPVPSLRGSDKWAHDIKDGYWAWDMDEGGWVSNHDLPPRLKDIEDIPF